MIEEKEKDLRLLPRTTPFGGIPFVTELHRTQPPSMTLFTSLDVLISSVKSGGVLHHRHQGTLEDDLHV